MKVNKYYSGEEGISVLGYLGVDLGVTMNSKIGIENLDPDTILDLLHITNREHRRFLITEKDKPIAAIIPLDEHDELITEYILTPKDTESLLCEYENELDKIL